MSTTKKTKKIIINSFKDAMGIDPLERTRYYSIGVGNSCFLRVQSINKKGAKAIVGKMRHPVTSKQIEYTIGSLGQNPKDPNIFTPQQGVEKWIEVRGRAKRENCDPNDFRKSAFAKLKTAKTLRDAVNQFLKIQKTKVKETTLVEYSNKLNQVAKIIGEDKFLYELGVDNDGDQVVNGALEFIRGNGKYDLEMRCRSLINRVFKLAETYRWIKKGQNPVITDRDALPSKPAPKHHPKLNWEDAEEFFEKLQLNRSNSAPQTLLCLKLIIITGLRAGSATRLKWEWINTKKGYIEFPPDTSGLKRNKGETDDIPHYVPLSKGVKLIIEKAKKYSTNAAYVFDQIKQNKRFPHLDPSAPNNWLRANGYEGKIVAHGLRRTFKTEGKEHASTDTEILGKCLGHLPEGKVNKAYDSSELLPARKKHQEEWEKLCISKGFVL